jgi:TolA-binding protein
MSAASPWLRPAAVLVLCALPAAAQEGDFAAKLFHSGERAYADKAYKEALETWKQLLQSAPRSEFAPRVLVALARYQAEVAHTPEAAFPYLDRLKAEYIKSPWAAEGLLLRGTLLARQAHRPADLKDAMAEFHRVIDLFPDQPAVAGAHLELGRAWRDQGQWGPALQHFIFAYRLHPDGPSAPQALLEAAETLDLTGDLPGCLRLLQRVRTEFPRSPAAQEAGWRMAVRVKLRITKPALRLEGPWPAGRVKWLKTPILLASADSGDLFLFQNDLDHAFRLKDGELAPVGPVAAGTRALVPTPGGGLWLLTRSTLLKEDGTSATLGALNAIAGGRLDRWGTLWVADARTPALTLLASDGTSRTLPSPTSTALAPLPTGGVVLASDGDRSLHFLDAEGQPRLTVPYGKDLPAPYKSVVALASDPLGHVAALVDGGDYGEGVVVYGPDGAVLRQATLRALGLSGRFTSLSLDRAGGVILCDRRNDTLFRVD